MAILNPFLGSGAGIPQPITAPQRKRRRRMNQSGFYEEEVTQSPSNVKFLGSDSNAVPQQQFARPPESGDYIAEHLAKIKARPAPPELTPGSRVKNPDTNLVNPNNFKTYYDQLGLLKQLDTDRTAAVMAQALQQRNAALKSVGNTAQPQQGGGAPAGQLKYSGGGNVMGWISQAADILKQNGVNLSPQDMQYVAIMIQHESGGNPNAINLWDSNAKAGIPSKGLMQTIDPTFNSNKLAGYNDIYNPVHNILAGIRYSIRRYGSIANVPGIRNLNSGRGYVGY